MVAGSVFSRAGRAGRVVACLAALALVPAAGDGGQRPPATPEEAVRLALGERWGAEGAPEHEVVDALVAAGPDAVPVLFRIACGEEPGLWEALEGRVTLERGPQRGAELACRALRRLPREVVLRHVTEHSGPSDPVGRRVAAFTLLTEIGRIDEVPHCLRIALSFPPEELAGPTLRKVLPSGLGRMFARMPQAVLAAAASFDELPAEVRTTLLDAFLEVDHPVALDVLPDLLGQGRDDAVVARLGELGASYPWRLTLDHGFLLRRLLVDEDWRMRRAACVLVGDWQDLDSFERVAALASEDPHPAVQRAASWSLHQMSRTDLQLDLEGWRRWFQAQTSAWNAAAQERAEALASDDPERRAAALRGLAQAPLFRHEAAPAVAGLLFEHPGMADAVAKILVDLDSRRAVPVLVDVLSTARSARTRQVVWMTLKRLTGREMTIDDPAWSSLVLD